MAGIDLYKEIVFGSADSTTAQRISDLEKQGKLRKIAPRLYTTNMKDSPEAIVRSSLPGSSRITRSQQSRHAMLTQVFGVGSSNGLYL